MADLSAREIYRFARLAGFSPDQAVTMTAIALAESGGNTNAHNPNGENSRGLWQINLDAHGGWAGGMNLFDPAQNARAAYRVSGGGQDVSPWTVVHGPRPRYLAYKSEALAAAAASGDTGVTGVWTGTEGYGHPLSAGNTGPGTPIGPTGGGESGSLQTFLDAAVRQTGDRYVFGAETGLDNPDPNTFDCSELVQWAAHQAGVEVGDGTWVQYLRLEQQGATISVEQAMKTPGALLFSFPEKPVPGRAYPQSHVAISLGDGRTIEARGRKYGVGSWSAENRFEYAAVIPGLSGGFNPLALGAATATQGGVDTDGDGLTDAMEARLGLSATSVDSDRDNLSDGYEMLRLRTNAAQSDTDGDGISDGMELITRTDPGNPDSDRDGNVDGATSAPDTDGDGITDPLELLLRTDPFAVDADGDGFTDGAEYRARFNPADPASNPLAPPVDPLGPPANPLAPPVDPLGPPADPLAPPVNPLGPSADPLTAPGTPPIGSGPRRPVPPPDPDNWGMDAPDLPAG
jgi:cell wall-associated NlpC family hydrolase